ncbi:hypothetical protein GGX14DRAFT_388765 [Mycena pura]|uniref:Secreted protein n=1 Tax=Mycena pura TaxID=153505 RepID=A0AAD6VVY7_9AGAR|nr:hypothetical protein GGX14DRAFT_388765 [Mycena pura]
MFLVLQCACVLACLPCWLVGRNLIVFLHRQFIFIPHNGTSVLQHVHDTTSKLKMRTVVPKAAATPVNGFPIRISGYWSTFVSLETLRRTFLLNVEIGFEGQLVRHGAWGVEVAVELGAKLIHKILREIKVGEIHHPTGSWEHPC